jgi:uncharacterized repeat protein (TIGR01451 family)
LEEHLRAKRFILATMAMLAFGCLTAGTAAAQVGGPVILGGDDLTDHGGTDANGASQTGWLYMERAVANVKSQVGRTNDNTIAALGSADPSPLVHPACCDAGEGILNAAVKNGMSVRFFDGEAAIRSALTTISNGTYRPAIMWVAGDGASNNLDGCSGPGTEGQAIADNAATINAFVNQGGGLFSHGTCYTWLSGLLPTLATVDGGSSGDLYRTNAGVSAFPGVSDADFNAGPWHNHFEGDFGGLSVLVRSANVQDSRIGGDAAVVIGGGQVSLTEKPTDLSVAQSASRTGNSLIYTITVRNNGPNPASGVILTNNLPAGVPARDVKTSQGSCTGLGTTQVRCSLGNLAVGGTATVQITVRPRSSGTLTNTVSVGGNQPDPNNANNSATNTQSFAIRRAARRQRRDRTRPRVRIAGVMGMGNSCVRRGFSARFRVREPRLRRVAVFLDGRRIMRTRRKVFRVRVNAASLRSGRHRLRAVAVDRARNRRVVRRAFTRCARPAAVPHFTG